MKSSFSIPAGYCLEWHRNSDRRELQASMFERTESTIVIERATGVYAWPWPLKVFIDGREAGTLNGKCAREFQVTPGEHDVAVSLNLLTADTRLTLRPYERIELMCTHNQLPLHPWLVKAFFGFVALGLLSAVSPAIRAFIVNNLVLEVVLLQAMGLAGLILYLKRSHAAGAWVPRLYLTPKTPDRDSSFHSATADNGNGA